MTPDLLNTALKHATCLRCGNHTPYRHDLGPCEKCAGEWWDAEYDSAALRSVFQAPPDGTTTGMWRYFQCLPLLQAQNISTAGEARTPLYHVDALDELLETGPVFIKDERCNPTGSFKDRQASLTISVLREQRVSRLVVCSSGNVAVSYAAYCARAGIELHVFLPQLAPRAKASEIALYGARVHYVDGNYDQAKQVAARFAEQQAIRRDDGARSVANRECMKTIAYEIFEQLGGRTPDWYVQAVSGGMGPIGVWKGCAELLQSGLSTRMPRIACVQTDRCAPMANAFQRGRGEAEAVTPSTQIPVLSTGDPGFSYTLLRQRLLETGGTCLAVPEDEALGLVRTLAAKAGLFVEPAAAVAFLGVRELARQKTIKAGDLVVVNCSGDGPRWDPRWQAGDIQAPIQ